MSATEADIDAEQFGPWNPGISSRVPDELLHLSTIFRPDCVFTSLATALEISDLIGLEAAEIVALRPSRLALHELLIRVTADFSVPDGEKIEDLGINFRRMTRALLERHIEPQMASITAAYDSVRRAAADVIERELARLSPASEDSSSVAAKKSVRTGLLGRFARVPPAAPASHNQSTRTATLVADWEMRAHTLTDPTQATAMRALARVVSALVIKHGSLWVGPPMIASIATDIAVNELAGDAIGRLMDGWLAAAPDMEGYRLLPQQQRPLVMNLKGPSAAGKSTIRPLQKALAGRIGVDWSEFALISPDIWRKLLLDYGALGTAYKYGGAFTAEELRIVDQKLDRYMARKAQLGRITHLLIDRFRFDSFAPDSNEAGSNLLTRFGQIVYLFCVITPPAALVERAWNRGLAVGRYKAVDDTLAHSVEAYSGIPHLFFTWVQRDDKQVHFEFLDNSVSQGEDPRTVAFGWNDVLNVLDIKCLLDVERYRKVNIDATAATELFASPPLLAPERNTGFLKDCVNRFREINFAHQSTGRVYLHIIADQVSWVDPHALAQAIEDADTRAALHAVIPAAFDPSRPAPSRAQFLARSEQRKTVGRWGSPDSSPGAEQP
jgi:hypothetical protein